MRFARGKPARMRWIVRFAAAVAATGALILPMVTTSSALAGARWEPRQVDVGTREGDGLFGVSCPTASLCVAVGNRGAIVTSGSPGDGAAAWRSETAPPGPYAGTAAGEADRTSPGTFESVSCPSAEMCAAVTYAGDFYASGNPGGGASTWRATDLDGDGADIRLKGVSCPTAAFCVAVATGGPGAASGSGGQIFSIAEPLSDPVSPVRVQLDEPLDLQAVSCPGPAFCIAVANQGRVVVSADPAGAAPTWREIGTPGGPGNLGAVDCPGARLCLAGNAGGNVLSSADADAATPHWREAGTGRSVQVTGISCPTASRCAIVDNNGGVAVSTDPTGPASWSATSLIPFPATDTEGLPFNALFAASCPSASFCAAVGSRGMIFTSSNPFDASENRDGRRRGGPRRPRLKILHGDHFARQAWTRGAGGRVTFRLRPYGRVRGFLCRLDRRRFRPCRSPLRIYAELGPHTLRARAIGVTGLRGPVAKDRFTIRGPNLPQR